MLSLRSVLLYDYHFGVFRVLVGVVVSCWLSVCTRYIRDCSPAMYIADSSWIEDMASMCQYSAGYMACCHLLDYDPHRTWYSVHSNVRAAESAYGLAMHVANSYATILLYSCTSESSCAISHDTITFTNVPKVLHFNVFLSHNLPYALSLTLSTVQKTINSHSTLHGSTYSYHASVTTLNLQYLLITSCYKQLGHSHSPKMHYFQLVIELYVPRNYAEGFAPWCFSFKEFFYFLL